MKKCEQLRIKYIYFFFISLFVILSTRIGYLQGFKKKFFSSLAQSQYYRLIPLKGKRGKILDCKGRILANGINSHSIFADPSLIGNLDETVEVISSKLALSKKELKSKLQKKKRFVWIKRKVSWKESEEIKLLKLNGIMSIREEKRFYPQENLSFSILGIVDIDNKGLGGLELSYDTYLQGKDGLVRVLQDASGETIFTPLVVIPAEGADIILTIDSQIQYWTENYLEETIKKFSAKKGSVVVMDAHTGGILALADYPSVNPNQRDEIFFGSMKNCAIADYFEPGSVFKVVTLLAAVGENKFSDEDIIWCEKGKFKIPGTILHDWKPYGELSFKDVFKKSSNIGVAKIVSSLGKTILYRYIKKLGFGEKTGVDLPGESAGVVKLPHKWSKTSKFIIPIGQEIGVNLLQLTRLFAVVANGGYLVKPHIVRNIRSQGFSKEIAQDKKRVVSSSVAQRVKNILIEVVEEGTGKLARIPGVKVGGKTGTAQKYDPKIKKYSPTKYRASFIGFIDDYRQPLVIGVTIDEPMKFHFGGVVAAPLFKEIAQKVVDYLDMDVQVAEKQEHKTTQLGH
ncbi:MAG: penicillin-binding protein 2 [Candidatus Omnitrophica bacterium]|nr:penicillin-binding protein 2 [Candidatus Omnitrophota bacterium]